MLPAGRWAVMPAPSPPRARFPASPTSPTTSRAAGLPIRGREVPPLVPPRPWRPDEHRSPALPTRSGAVPAAGASAAGRSFLRRGGSRPAARRGLRESGPRPARRRGAAPPPCPLRAAGTSPRPGGLTQIRRCAGQRAACSPSSAGSAPSQPSETTTTTAPRAMPRRPWTSRNSLITRHRRVPPTVRVRPPLLGSGPVGVPDARCPGHPGQPRWP